MADDTAGECEFIMGGNRLDPNRLPCWSSWAPHQRCWFGDLIPNAAGLYRSRRINGPVLDYIGQFGGGAGTSKGRNGTYPQNFPHNCRMSTHVKNAPETKNPHSS